jgi:hypothetical protein
VPSVTHFSELAERAIEEVRIARKHLVDALSTEAMIELAIPDSPQQEFAHPSNDTRAAVECSIEDYARAIERYHEALRCMSFEMSIWPV